MASAAVTNGAELVKRLKKTGTPDQRLAPARAVLAGVKKDRGEIANSEQVIAALEDAYGPNHMTVVKARSIAQLGSWSKPAKERPVEAVEEELLADKDAPVSTADPVRRQEKAGGKPRRVRKAIETKKIQDAEPAGV